MRLLKQFYLEFFDSRIQRQFDMGVIVKSHVLLKNRNIKHLVFVEDEEYELYIPIENRANVSWKELSVKYPDDLKTSHTSWEGHVEIYNTLKNKLK